MKRRPIALWQSLICLLLCVSMLVGTTFAWFTDQVVSGKNTIAAGNLDVELYHSNAVVQNEQVKTDTLLFKDLQGNPILWEPGVVSYENLRVTNAGDLALQYQLAMETANENFVVYPDGTMYGLSQILKVGVVEGGITATDRAGVVASVDTASWTTLASFLRSGTLLPAGKGESEKTWGVVIYWQPGDNDNLWNLNNGKQLNTGDVLSIDLGVKLVATQFTSENDSFGPDYDQNATFPGVTGGSVSAQVPAENNIVTADTVLQGNGFKALVPAGTKLADGVTQLTFSVFEKEGSDANLTLDDEEEMYPLDVHIEGTAPDNDKPILVTIEKAMTNGLNIGNYKLYHVENGVANEMTAVDAADLDAHNEFTYDPATGDITLAMQTFSEVALTANIQNPWNGYANVDHSWYDADAEILTIANADQLFSFSQIVGGIAKIEGKKVEDDFEGQTINLISDINLDDGEGDNDPNKIFYPIGYYNNDEEDTYKKNNKAVNSSLKNFKGTFDGQGHTIANFYHNTWEMKGDHNWYAATDQHYRDGMGLFGRVYGGTIKNLTVDNFKSDGEIATTGVIAAYADFGATFENIAIFNCNPRVYNIGNGGIVGCVGWYTKGETDKKVTFKNITVDNTNKISALWGSYDVACGGIVGQYYPTSGQTSAGSPKNAGIYMENCHVAAQMDVFNDVCGNYQYYAYRYAGMMIGSIRENTTNDDGKTIPNMDGIAAKNCTVNYGNWNGYYYCELVANSLASYTHDHQFSRLDQIANINLTTMEYQPMNATKWEKIPATGRVNYVIVTGERTTENAECYHFVDGRAHNHNDYNGDGKEDFETVNGESVYVENNRHIYLPFYQLYTGYGWGVNSIGLEEHGGIVTDLGIEKGNYENSNEKFYGISSTDTYSEGESVSIGSLFAPKEHLIKGEQVQVFVSPVGENSTVSAVYVPGENGNWTAGTLTFSGIGAATITITDYYFCTPTTITVSITERQPVKKFETKFTGDFLYRVGSNKGSDDKGNIVKLDSLFKAKDGATIGNVSVTVEPLNGTGASGTYTSNAAWENGTIQFSNTGIVKVTIKDDDKYCTPTELILEVVDAVNATTATSATSYDVVLLANSSFGSLEVSGGYTLYGNGFTMTCSSDSYAVDRTYSFIELDNGTLDNVQVVVPNFSHSILYDENKKENDNPNYKNTEGRIWYYNIRSAVVMKGDSKIANSFVSGGRAAVYCISGNPTIENSTIMGGAAANIHVEQNNNLTIKDVTLIQKPIKANVNTLANTVMGLSVVVICDSSGAGAEITLDGKLRQYAWANSDYAKYVPEDGKSLITEALKKTAYIHNVVDESGVKKDSVNLGFVYMPENLNYSYANVTDNRAEQKDGTVPYGVVTVGSRAQIYTYKADNGTHVDVQTEPGYLPSAQIASRPVVKYTEVNENRVFTTAYNDGWTATLKVDVDAGEYNFTFDKLVVEKYGKKLSYTVTKLDGTKVDKNQTILLNNSATYEFVLTITDDQIYDQCAVLTGKTTPHTYKFVLMSTMTSLPAPEWAATTLTGTPYIVANSKDGDWNVAVPVLDGMEVNYYSKAQNKEIKNFDLSSVPLGSSGEKNGKNNSFTITVPDEYTLTISTENFKSNDNGKPVVVNGKLYFTVSSDSNYVSTKTTDREIFITYTFTDANNSEPIKLERKSFKVLYSNYKSTQYKYSDFCKGTLTELTGCVTGDTLVTLADGTQKRIDQVTYNDNLLVWNFFKGEYAVVPSALIVNHGYGDQTIIKLTFEDGTVVKAITAHSFFDANTNKWELINAENADSYIGHAFVQATADSYKTVKLTDVEVYQEYTESYSLVSACHYNFITENMFSLTNSVHDMLAGLVVGENMTYDYKVLESDMRTYGRYTYDDFADYISYRQYVAFNGDYLKISVEKGYITFDAILALIEAYL